MGADVWIKGEFASVLSSFKLRGALNHLLADDAGKDACTSSTGNHGQAVAYAARLLGRSADIFLPEGCPETKRAAIARLGARLHVGGADLDDAKQVAKTFAAVHDLSFVDDGESPHVIAGAGTLGLEIGRALPKAEYVFAPTGSACLASGTALGLKAADSPGTGHCRPIGADALHGSQLSRPPAHRASGDDDLRLPQSAHPSEACPRSHARPCLRCARGRRSGLSVGDAHRSCAGPCACRARHRRCPGGRLGAPRQHQRLDRGADLLGRQCRYQHGQTRPGFAAARCSTPGISRQMDHAPGSCRRVRARWKAAPPGSR